MGIHNRPYWKSDEERPGAWGGDGNVRLGLPKPTPAVLTIMGLCAVLYFLTLLTGRNSSLLYNVLALYANKTLELWRLVTFQFMHVGTDHFLWNMVGLYFFAPPLERAWGWRRFTAFYLATGAFGGLCFTALVYAVIPQYPATEIVGASGGILACLMACAILFPEMIFIIVPIRWAAAFLFVLYLLRIIYEFSLADAAHLGGMVAATLWILVLPRLHVRAFWRRTGIHRRMVKSAWKRRMEKRSAEQSEIDRILQKIHDEGLNSLTHRERKTLADATKHQQQEDEELRKT